MKLPKLWNVNCAALATLYKGNKIVGTCMDTPNALAYGFAKTGATRAESALGIWKAKDMANRVANQGWLKSDAEAMFKAS